jgi:hypothetical protein
MDTLHRVSDEQSLRLTKAALDCLLQRPEMMVDVVATLDHWDQVAPKASQPIRDQWRNILRRQDWNLLLDPGPEGQQLRQASPLGKALPPAQRLAIIRVCKGSNSNT